MVLLGVFGLLTLLAVVAAIWGVDSRDGRDWGPSPYPTGSPPTARDEIVPPMVRHRA